MPQSRDDVASALADLIQQARELGIRVEIVRRARPRFGRSGPFKLAGSDADQESGGSSHCEYEL